MNGHVDELVEEYALGLLEAAEAERVEAHAADCADCRSQLDSAIRASAMLAALAEPAQPEESTRQRLLFRTQNARQKRRPRQAPARQPGRPALGWLWPAAAGLSLTLAVVMAVWNVSLQSQIGALADENRALAERVRRQEARVALVSSAQVAVVDMAGTEDAPESQGRAYLDPNTGTVWVTVSGLPQVSDDWTYQVWLIGPDGPVSAGFLNSGTDGRREVWLNDVPSLTTYQAVGVSLEQAGGSPRPTRVVTVGGL